MKYLYLIILLVPFFTGFWETGHAPITFNAWIKELILTGLVGLLLFDIYRKHKKLEQIAFIDPLTEVHNRRNFQPTLEREILRARRTNSVLALIYLDINEFKQLNDQYGHEMGDKVLIELGKRINAFIRRGEDYCFRVGGDEFVILITGIKLDSSNQIFNKIQLRLDNEILKNMSNDVSIASGVSILTESDTPASIIKRTDALMYKNKPKHNH